MQHNLIINNISKSYKYRTVVDNVSLKIKSGDVVGLLGPNGSGKTTCFQIISGLIKANSGDIFLDNKKLNKLPIDKRSLLGIGYLSQEASIFRGLSVVDNIMAVLQTQKKIKKKQRLEQLEQLLDEFNIASIRNLMGVSLSGGERRRVEIARILAIKPRFILLDEPFSGVDPISITDLQNLIYNLKNKNIGILITDHNFRELLDTCDYSYVLNEGKIISEGSKENILKNKQVQKVYLGEKYHG